MLRFRALGATFLCATLAMVSGRLWAQETASGPAAAPPTSQLLTLIDRFLDKPFSNANLRAALLDSAEARPDVAISISEGVTPWLMGTDTATFRKAMTALFLAGYIAGDMREQLRTGHKDDQPYPGTQSVLRLHLMVRERRPEYHQATLDQWLALDSAGTLKPT